MEELHEATRGAHVMNDMCESIFACFDISERSFRNALVHHLSGIGTWSCVGAGRRDGSFGRREMAVEVSDYRYMFF
jgi:hypothetical protein